jgi:hypothetical protein
VSRKDSSRDSIVATSVAGVSAGLVASVITCPLDVVKTRMQAQAGASAHHVRYRGTLPSLRTILAEEGIRGLCNRCTLEIVDFDVIHQHASTNARIVHQQHQSILISFSWADRGLWPTMVGLTCNWAVYFACYDRFQKAFGTVRTSQQPALELGSCFSFLTAAFALPLLSCTIACAKSRLSII